MHIAIDNPTVWGIVVYVAKAGIIVVVVMASIEWLRPKKD